VIGADCTGSCKSKYHTITTTTAPSLESGFLARLAKSKVSVCYHLASVVRRLLSVNFYQKQELPVATMFVNEAGRIEHFL
jgi:hypothetical protein